MEKIDIPKDLLHIILEYDGRIKYKKGNYINIIKKNDFRYNILNNIISKKLQIIRNTEIRGSTVYFDVRFENIKNRNQQMSICYDHYWPYDRYWSFNDKYDICFYYHHTWNGPIRIYL